jgi:hypothetical protein
MNTQRHEQAHSALLNYVKHLAGLDEPLLALKVLQEYCPAFYRDNPTDEIKKLQRIISSQLFTMEDYYSNDGDFIKEHDHAQIVDNLTRGQVIASYIDHMNSIGIKPIIFDLGPGDFWLPLGLKKKGLNFSYQYEGVCAEASNMFEAEAAKLGLHIDTTPKAAHCFIACEIIEHLFDPIYIRQRQLLMAPVCNAVILSTPKYCYDGVDIEIEKQQHFRVYTPKEFIEEARKIFPEFHWSLVDSEVMVVIGERP